MGLAAKKGEGKNVIISGEESELLINMEMALVLFECIKDYPTLHSTPYLVNTIIAAISQDLPGIGDFLDSRMRNYEGIHIPTTQS